ncbi:MAG: hypothetical protein ACOYOO_10910, partial [Saprospiraceae bacterium]
SKHHSARSAVKNLFTQPQDYFEIHIVFEISRSEISKTMCISKDNLVRSAMKSLLLPSAAEYAIGVVQKVFFRRFAPNLSLKPMCFS